MGSGPPAYSLDSQEVGGLHHRRRLEVEWLRRAEATVRVRPTDPTCDR